jgi:hypothetical protein
MTCSNAGLFFAKKTGEELQGSCVTKKALPQKAGLI